MRYRVYQIAVHTIGAHGRPGAVDVPSTPYNEEAERRSIVVETNEVVNTYQEALTILNDVFDPGASGGVRDFIVSASITLEP